MGDEAVNATFGKLFAALLARVLVSVGGIFKFGTAVEVLKDDRMRLPTHDVSWPANVSIMIGAGQLTHLPYWVWPIFIGSLVVTARRMAEKSRRLQNRGSLSRPLSARHDIVPEYFKTFLMHVREVRMTQHSGEQL